MLTTSTHPMPMSAATQRGTWQTTASAVCRAAVMGLGSRGRRDGLGHGVNGGDVPDNAGCECGVGAGEQGAVLSLAALALGLFPSFVGTGSLGPVVGSGRKPADSKDSQCTFGKGAPRRREESGCSAKGLAGCFSEGSSLEAEDDRTVGFASPDGAPGRGEQESRDKHKDEASRIRTHRASTAALVSGRGRPTICRVPIVG